MQSGNKKHKTKILHVITSLEIGGAQRLLSDLLPLLARNEDITLLVYERVNNDFEKKVLAAGIRIISLNEHNYYNPRVILKIRNILKDYDIVHAHLFPTIYWVSLASIGLKTKLVYTEHSTSNSRRDKWYFKPIEKIIYSRFEKIISISKQTQDALASWIGHDYKRLVVINNGVDTLRFASINRKVIPKSIIMVSRFAASKDQETLIRAMKYVDSDAILRLVGDGETLNYCKQVAVNEGVADRVQFLGVRSDIAELVAESYIGVQSSNWEGFGLTAVELMAAGKPVIASDVNGLKQVVEGAGLIFHKGRCEELAKYIVQLLSDEHFYASVSRQCKERSTAFDIMIMAEKYNGLYNDIANNQTVDVSY